ncbi:BrnA antitoxin family protein [Xanthobacter sp. V3C-3]|uniref:BrnA antitoxin family protein n=1 Tax=Xanthobacter lutulentifluminis TaxID=3119935 RepID=UPI0037286AF6
MSVSDPRAKARARARASRALISAEEDAAITEAAGRDPDNPPLNEADMAAFKAMSETAAALAGSPRKRGPKTIAAGAKRLTSLRLDPDVLEHYRSAGPGWQARINSTLRKAAGL